MSSHNNQEPIWQRSVVGSNQSSILDYERLSSGQVSQIRSSAIPSRPVSKTVIFYSPVMIGNQNLSQLLSR